MPTKLEKARSPEPHGRRTGFSLAVSKVSEDIISVIKQASPTLRPSERRVAEAVLADVNFALHCANGELARRAGVSEPTVTRFSRAIGCAGVRELKVKLAQSLVVGRIYLETPPSVGDNQDKPTLWQVILDDIHRAINTAERQLVIPDFERASEAITSCDKLVTFGVGGGSTRAVANLPGASGRSDISLSNGFRKILR